MIVAAVGLFAALAGAVEAAPAASEGAALELLSRYDAVMSPTSFEITFSMTAHREDGSTRTYRMRGWKSGTDKFRAVFEAPASAKDQEILRAGDNLWVWLPNLKRSVRLASRESFQGGDFNNADVLRANYGADYVARVEAREGDRTTLELKARGPEVAYDRIRLTLLPDGVPVTAEFFAGSGKLLRVATYLDPQPTGAAGRRPSGIRMENKLVPDRWSELVTESFRAVDSIPDATFSVTSLGR